jgi:MoaA/NifB/PqqE/SkfB family radical SAM enzyme
MAQKQQKLKPLKAKAFVDKQREEAVAKKKYWLRLTRACNNNCLFCLDKEMQNGQMVPLKEVLSELKKGRRQNFKQVILSGGEPTIHPEFLAIVNEARKNGFDRIQVITNGRMFSYEDFLRQAIAGGVNEITFSLHGHNEKLHDLQTGIKGSFCQAIKALQNALSFPGLIVNVDIVINKINCRYLSDILRFYIDLGVREFDLLQVVPFGSAWKNRRRLFYDINKALPHLQKAFSLAREKNALIWTNRLPPIYLEKFEELIQHPDKLYDEIRGRNDMFVKFIKKGEMMECRGERCKHCFLAGFCEDLEILREKGEARAKNIPACLRKKVAVSEKHSIKMGNVKNICDFLKFFIDFRYFLKGSECQKCIFNINCEGMRCNYIRQHGFKSLKPIKK